MIKKILKIIVDLLGLNIAVIVSFFLKNETITGLEKIYPTFFIYSSSFLLVCFVFKFYNNSWRFTGVKDSFYILINLLGVLIISTALQVLFKIRIEKTFEIMVLSIFLISIITTRFVLILFRLKNLNRSQPRENTLIYGAGEAGVLLIREASINKNFPFKIVGLIDDDKKKHGERIAGYYVYGDIEIIEEIIKTKKVSQVILAIPSLDRKKMSKILDKINRIENISVKILPNIGNILDNKIEKKDLLNQVRNIKMEDLLGRDEVVVNTENIHKFINNKVIFVTGGGGSIGSELIRQISKYGPKKIVNIEINENTAYLLELEIKRMYSEIDLVTEIASVREEKKLAYLFEKYKPQILFHAAAHKHVPLMENNPEEAVKNNIFGTKNVAECSLKYNLEKVILISTDKAVNPTNIMGATKRVCEMIFQKYNEKSKTTIFSAVRFGNVLGSNGSVIPIFSKLIEEGKNLTLTHKDIIRYFMTIPEAAQLVIEAGYLGKGGEIFILDMGEPVKIYDLAKNMIKLSGSNIGIDIVGLRPGEKLYEELLYDVDASEKTANNKIFVTNMENEKVNVDIENYYKLLKDLCDNNNQKELRKVVAEIIGTFKGVV